MATALWMRERGELLRKNRNLLKSSPLSSLQDLAAPSIDLERCLQHKELFFQLPEDVIERLMSHPSCRLRSPQFFPLVLLKPERRSVLVPCYPEPLNRVPGHSLMHWDKEEVESVLRLARDNCAPGSLEKLSLCPPGTFRPKIGCWHVGAKFCVFREPDLEPLHALIKEQPALKEINLMVENFYITRQTISIIANTCHELRFLSFDRLAKKSSLSGGYEIPDPVRMDVSMVRELCRGCPLLEHLQYNGGITSGAVTHALRNLEHLVNMKISLENLRDLSSTVNVPSTLRPHFYFQSEHDTTKCLHLLEVCPNLTTLSIYPTDNQVLDLSRFRCNSTKNLLVYRITSANVPRIEPFLEQCGSETVRLTLGYVDKVKVSQDLSILTEHCPRLEEIRLRNVVVSDTCRHEVTAEKVRSVRCLTLRGLGTPPDQFLRPLLCNGALEHLELPTLSSELLETLTHEMRAAVERGTPSPVLPRLTHLRVERVGGERITLQQAVDLVTLAPRVRWVHFKSLSEADIERLEQFMETYAPGARYHDIGFGHV